MIIMILHKNFCLNALDAIYTYTCTSSAANSCNMIERDDVATNAEKTFKKWKNIATYIYAEAAVSLWVCSRNQPSGTLNSY